MYRTRDGQSFKSLDTLARTLTHRAPGTVWSLLEQNSSPYWTTLRVQRTAPNGARVDVATVEVPRSAHLAWLRGRAPKVVAKRLVRR